MWMNLIKTIASMVETMWNVIFLKVTWKLFIVKLEKLSQLPNNFRFKEIWGIYHNYLILHYVSNKIQTRLLSCQSPPSWQFLYLYLYPFLSPRLQLHGSTWGSRTCSFLFCLKICAHIVLYFWNAIPFLIYLSRSYPSFTVLIFYPPRVLPTSP